MNEEIKEDVKEVNPKRSWVKRHKVALIITIIALAIIIASLAGFIGYVNAWNEGMGLPEGYHRRGSPLTSSAKYSDNLILKYQFEEENPQNLTGNKIWFRYNEEKYRIQSNGNSFSGAELEHIVYQETDETRIGGFVSQFDDVWSWHYGRTLFFDDHYIYYPFIQVISRKVYHIHDGEWVYRKYTFYRFDLDTGSNEEVKIELFVEKINKYDETIKIN